MRDAGVEYEDGKGESGNNEINRMYAMNYREYKYCAMPTGRKNTCK